MEYPMCVVGEPVSRTAQRRYYIGDDVWLGALQWENWIVLLLTLLNNTNFIYHYDSILRVMQYEIKFVLSLSLTHEQHRSNIPVDMV